MVVRIWILSLAILALAACAIDSEEAVRGKLARWVWPGEVLDFTSRPTCTAAVFALATPGLRKTVKPVQTVDAGLAKIRDGQPVVFTVPGLGPHAVSEAVMTGDLSIGIGLLSNGVGPAKRCLSEEYEAPFHAALMAPGAITIYEVGNDTMIVVHTSAERIYFMRGNV